VHSTTTGSSIGRVFLRTVLPGALCFADFSFEHKRIGDDCRGIPLIEFSKRIIASLPTALPPAAVVQAFRKSASATGGTWHGPSMIPRRNECPDPVPAQNRRRPDLSVSLCPSARNSIPGCKKFLQRPAFASRGSIIPESPLGSVLTGFNGPF